MKNNVYKSHVTGNTVIKKDDAWYDTVTNKRLMNYQVYKFVSLSKKSTS